MRYAVILISSGAVANIILLDDPTAWPVPAGFEILQSDTANIGDTWNGTEYVPPTPPPPTVQQVFDTKIAAGIAVTSTGTPAISATYALDPTTLDQVGSVARDAASGLGLPNGVTLFIYPDASGNPKSLTATNVQNLYKAMRDLVSTLNQQLAVAAAGGTPTWPAQTATIA